MIGLLFELIELFIKLAFAMAVAIGLMTLWLFRGLLYLIALIAGAITRNEASVAARKSPAPPPMMDGVCPLCHKPGHERSAHVPADARTAKGRPGS